MIKGTVNPKRQPTVSLALLGANGQQETIEALVDTGYNGALTLAPEAIAALGLVQRRTASVMLADGTTAVLPVYAVRVIWDDTERIAQVLAGGSQPLLGMSLVLGHALSVEMIDGGEVTIRRL